MKKIEVGSLVKYVGRYADSYGSDNILSRVLWLDEDTGQVLVRPEKGLAGEVEVDDLDDYVLAGFEVGKMYITIERIFDRFNPIKYKVVAIEGDDAVVVSSNGYASMIPNSKFEDYEEIK